MTIGEKALRKIFRERDSFEFEEIDLANRIISAHLEGSARTASLPSRYASIGDSIVVGGIRYACIEARKVSAPMYACEGCDFSKKYRSCADVMCSPFDRLDGKFVWFLEEE